MPFTAESTHVSYLQYEKTIQKFSEHTWLLDLCAIIEFDLLLSFLTLIPWIT